MADSIYGGVTYPHTLYSIDKTYPNFTEAQSGASGDGVLIGRYVLVAYSSRALDQDEKNHIVSTIKGNPKGYHFDNEEYKYYASNLMFDSNNNPNKLHSYDRHILRKKYDNEKNKMVYEDIAVLNSTLSDASIIVEAVESADKVLDLSNGVLSSDITLEYKDRKIYLYGKDKETEISYIDASDFIKDGMIKSVKLTEVDGEGNKGKFLEIIWDTRELDDGEQITYVDLTTLIDVYTSGDGVKVEKNKISIKMDEASEIKYLSLSEQGLKLTGIAQLEEELDNKIQVTEKNVDMNEQATIQIVLDGTGFDIGLDQDFVTTDQVYMTDQIDEMFAKISTDAEPNVQADWNEENREDDAYIQNKPTKLSQFENDLGVVPNTRKINDKSLTEDITLTPSDIGAAAINDNAAGDDTTYSSNKINSLLDGKVGTETGKGLSTNDFTDEYQSKLKGIAPGAQVNVQADWNATEASKGAILNKPTNLATIDDIPTTLAQLDEDENHNLVKSDQIMAWNNKYGTVEDLPIIPINKGGTGATTAEEARNELNVYSIAEINERGPFIEKWKVPVKTFQETNIIEIICSQENTQIEPTDTLVVGIDWGSLEGYNETIAKDYSKIYTIYSSNDIENRVNLYAKFKSSSQTTSEEIPIVIMVVR